MITGQTLLVNALVQTIAARYPDVAAAARARLLDVIGGALVEGPPPGN